MKRIWEYLRELETNYCDSIDDVFDEEASDNIFHDFKRMPTKKELDYAIWVLKGRPHKKKDGSSMQKGIAT